MAYRPKAPSFKTRRPARTSAGAKQSQRPNSSRATLNEEKKGFLRGREFEAKPEMIPKSKAAAVRAQEEKALEEQKRAARSKRWAEQRAGAAQRDHDPHVRGVARRERVAGNPASRDLRAKKETKPGSSKKGTQDPKTAASPALARRTSKLSLRKNDPKPAEAVAVKAAAPERIAKVIARAGVCSRRDAESFIEQGRVSLNGMIIDSPALNVSAQDEVRVDGSPLGQREKTRLFLFHKPRGLVTTDRDPEGRPTVFEHLRKTWSEGPRVMSVGRLDINTEGLLLLTNDGGLARVLELPSTGWTRRYRVRANGKTDQAVLDALREGVTIDGVDYAGIEAAIDRQQGANVWLTISLREGKNREVKRVLEHIGLLVNRLIRLSFGPFQLGEIAEGAVNEVKTKILADQLGPALSESAGADFLSPVLEELEHETRDGRSNLARDGTKRPADGQKTREVSPEKPVRAKRDYARREPGRPRSLQEAREPELRPKRVRPVPGPRKHVSVLREAAADKNAPRQTIARSTATDRKGRTIAVERVSNASGGEISAGSHRNKSHFESEKKPGPVPSASVRQGRTRDKTQSKENRGRTERPKNYGGASTVGLAKPARQTRHLTKEAVRKSPRKIIDAVED